MATRRATSSRASMYDQSTDMRKPPASHGTRPRRVCGGAAEDVVWAAAAERRAPARAPERRTAGVDGEEVAARRSGARKAEATA
uniref:K-exchanger-like protein n=1 Tax=Arundo donax TaxID=35708 RepID=A0A0A9FI14_ARUDO